MTLFDYIAFMEDQTNVGKYVFIKKIIETGEVQTEEIYKCTLLPNGEVRKKIITSEQIASDITAMEETLAQKQEDATIIASI